ncbi:putative transmembrane protein [Toxoplasma gondii RUB]|uniref:Transmembrane protein n=10 Tax=Toxoplasma gondii TaxID=5811 RepID=S7WGH1_TOXGG|nr:hypothetical protein TGGT1_249300 [Toxoplasma gondii GT1]KAF4638695.1 hypothetical protein TGRH88_063030 [Toxoplasma gondii]KFG46340.1 putative transmembrane protein [Toxoplasma gondii GAB2-2007-GAL-DOM2]KFG48728.1 putative transmembrane protein [Toxoplasma gondii p89]KFG54199.1 putative transmembrane protein [Toxoplasma gondii FOU]KFG64311.1 putative transmembrane protein [Toxoplasma gondii RUB]KFH10721.1 putative transmembrane protein [Toxoplasma gondii MAS]KFH12021.1 putative transmemb
MSSTADDELPRILFLHGMDGGPAGNKQRLLQRAVGRSNFLAPDLKSRKIVLLYTIAFGCFVTLILGCVVLFWIFTAHIHAILFTMAAVPVCFLAYYLTGRWLSSLILTTGVREASAAFHRYRPQVIVASSFGAVVAFHMDIPKMPLLLFTPAQEMYRRYLRIPDQMSLRNYPYTLIVHGSRDTVVSLQDSIRLVETSELGRCRLEVVDDDHRLRSLTQQEISAWIEEVFRRGRANVLLLAQQGDKSVDPSLYETRNLEAGDQQEEDEETTEATNTEQGDAASAFEGEVGKGDDVVRRSQMSTSTEADSLLA